MAIPSLYYFNFLRVSEPSPSVEIAENVVHDTITKVGLAPRHTQELAALSIDSDRHLLAVKKLMTMMTVKKPVTHLVRARLMIHVIVYQHTETQSTSSIQYFR
jgi:hypothetical protein